MAVGGDVDYERTGSGYGAQRRPDPVLAARIRQALGPVRTVLNVGAGTGSYEPQDCQVLAVEPSAVMRAQRLVFSLVPAKRLAAMGVEKKRFLQALDQTARIDYRSRLGQVTAKTLVLVGGNDRANLQAARDLAAGIAGARLEIIPGAGHQPNVDSPEAFNALVWPFLTDEDKPSAD